MPWIGKTVLLLGLAFPALAADPEVLGSFETWTAAVATEKTGKVCYMASPPAKSEGNYTRRDPVFVTVTHRTAAKSRDEVSLAAGYGVKPDSDVIVEIGDKKFRMRTRASSDPDIAWTDDAAADKALVEAMAKGMTMVVKAISARGTATVDTFSLAGFSKARAEIDKACAIK